ncbi:unnamed protein product, partial [marine sediment metagenome]
MFGKVLGVAMREPKVLRDTLQRTRADKGKK